MSDSEHQFDRRPQVAEEQESGEYHYGKKVAIGGRVGRGQNKRNYAHHNGSHYNQMNNYTYSRGPGNHVRKYDNKAPHYNTSYNVRNKRGQWKFGPRYEGELKTDEKLNYFQSMIGQEMAIYLRRDAKKWEPGWSQDERTGWWKKTDGDGGGWVPIEVIKDALRERMDLFDTDLSTDLITTIARNSEDQHKSLRFDIFCYPSSSAIFLRAATKADWGDKNISKPNYRFWEKVRCGGACEDEQDDDDQDDYPMQREQLQDGAQPLAIKDLDRDRDQSNDLDHDGDLDLSSDSSDSRLDAETTEDDETPSHHDHFSTAAAQRELIYPAAVPAGCPYPQNPQFRNGKRLESPGISDSESDDDSRDVGWQRKDRKGRSFEDHTTRTPGSSPFNSSLQTGTSGDEQESVRRLKREKPTNPFADVNASCSRGRQRTTSGNGRTKPIPHTKKGNYVNKGEKLSKKPAPFLEEVRNRTGAGRKNLCPSLHREKFMSKGKRPDRGEENFDHDSFFLGQASSDVEDSRVDAGF